MRAGDIYLPACRDLTGPAVYEYFLEKVDDDDVNLIYKTDSHEGVEGWSE